jgi:ribosomal protein S18
MKEENMAEFYKKKKKICQMCAGKDVDYKNADIIKKYISSDKCKILPRRVTGNCAKHQRYIANEIKKARFMAIIPFVK